MEKMKVLIADDIRNLAEHIEKIVLKNDKFEVIGIANNGQEELDMIMNLQPEIVFTDNQMPIMNGLEVIEKIKNSDLENKPKFMVVTSDTTKVLFNQCAELDIISVIGKPISNDRIYQILDEIEDMKGVPVPNVNREHKIERKHSFLTKLFKKQRRKLK